VSSERATERATELARSRGRGNVWVTGGVGDCASITQMLQKE
jgi:hypothetical protein